MTHEKRRYRPPIEPIGADAPVVNWSDLDGGRDGFVALVSRSIDALEREGGYTPPYDGPQLAAWLESPDRSDRRKASFNLALLRQAMEDLARNQGRTS